MGDTKSVHGPQGSSLTMRRGVTMQAQLHPYPVSHMKGRKRSGWRFTLIPSLRWLRGCRYPMIWFGPTCLSRLSMWGYLLNAEKNEECQSTSKGSNYNGGVAIAITSSDHPMKGCTIGVIQDNGV